MSDKEAVLEVIRRMPDTATRAEIYREIDTLAAIQRGVEAADAGRVKSHEEVKRLVIAASEQKKH